MECEREVDKIPTVPRGKAKVYFFPLLPQSFNLLLNILKYNGTDERKFFIYLE